MSPTPATSGPSAAIPLALLPLATLLLGTDGTVTEVNEAWAALSHLSRAASLGQGWLDGIEPLDRELVRDRLRSASAERQGGSTEWRLTGPEAPRWSRWWWQPAPGDGLVVCVADIDDERTREASLWERATHDPLTGLVNRAHFVDLVDRALQRRGRAEVSPAVAYVDLDGFKTINDNGGHHVGDGVLRAAAERMAAAIRPADVIGRIGGDEFAVLYEAPAQPEEGDSVAQRIHRALGGSGGAGGITDVTATIGVAVAGPEDTAETLLARADQAMYAAKPHRRKHSPTDVGPGDPVAARTRRRPSVDHRDRAPLAELDLARSGPLLADLVIDRIFHVALALHDPDGASDQRVQHVVGHLDALIRDIQLAVFSQLTGPLAEPASEVQDGRVPDDQDRIDKLESAALIRSARIEALEAEGLDREAAALVSDARIIELMHEVEHLQAAGDQVAVIEQAKGVLMSEMQIGANAAFAALIAASIRDGVKLLEVAQRIAAAQDQHLREQAPPRLRPSPRSTPGAEAPALRQRPPRRR